MDRFHELNAFIAVVEAGGFSAAARRTGDSQSAISKAIGALEKRLGVALFNRSTRSVTLTDQGQRYYDRTKPLVDEMDDADSELTSSTQNVSGLIRIAASGTFGRLHVLPLIPDLLSLNPGLQVDLVLSDFVRDMVEDRIDLAIRVGPVNDPTRSSGAWPALPWYASDPVATSSNAEYQRPPRSSLITIAFYMAA
jgi:DNA-binding transcriptional LysR family regulator